MPVVLRTEKLVAGYRKLRVLQGVDVYVRKGEMVALLGPNGSGKSTLIKSIVGLADIFEGRVLYNGSDITGMRTDKVVKMGIGYVPQVNNVFTNLTVEENLEMGLYVLDEVGDPEGCIEDILELFPELRRHRKDKVGKLSGGLRQMVAIGRALISNPQLLLLDEPTASLAPKVAVQVLEKVREIADNGIPILIAEQNAKAALAYSDRAYILVSGRCIKEGHSHEILEDKEIGRLYLGLKVDESALKESGEKPRDLLF